ncbi:MAG: hypothetical protein K2Y37_07880 [Pirellulales bacterium]|nr:hypothetical protein [Pirellulales bacterium]
MATDPTRDVLDQIRLLSQEQQHEILREVEKLVSANDAPSVRPRILELKGLGKEIWSTIDVDEYLNRERDSWDG